MLALRRAACAARRASRGAAGAPDVDSANQDLASFFGEVPVVDPAPPMTPESRQAPPLHASAAPHPPTPVLTHVDARGRLGMVDVGHKAETRRSAVASARVYLGSLAFAQVQENRLKKGDVLVVAQLAGIQAAKLTSQLIPLCHALSLSWVDVNLSLDPQREAVNIRAQAQTTGTTGVEMEALTAAAVAGLTVYDMVKAVTKEARLSDVQLEHKDGGRTGSWTRIAS